MQGSEGTYQGGDVANQYSGDIRGDVKACLVLSTEGLGTSGKAVELGSEVVG